MILQLWLVGWVLVLLAIFVRQLENQHFLSLRRKNQEVNYWSELWGGIAHNQRVLEKTSALDGIAKRAELKFVKNGAELLAFTVFGNLAFGTIMVLIWGMLLSDLVKGLLIGIASFLVGLLLFPYSVKAEADKKTKKLDQEVMYSLPLFRSFFDAGAKGKDILNPMILALGNTPLGRRLDEVKELIFAQGFSFTESLKHTAKEWDSRALDFLVDLIEKAEKNGSPVSDEIAKQLEQSKEQELLDAEAEAGKKENITLMVSIVVLFLPGVSYVLYLTILFSGKYGF